MGAGDGSTCADDDPPGVHHDNAVGDLQRVQFVGDEETVRPLTNSRSTVDVSFTGGVDACEFVRIRMLVPQDACQSSFLFLAAGEV